MVWPFIPPTSAVRFTLLLLLVPSLALGSCRSLDRLFRNSPLAGVEAAADRVNLWPVYYQNGEHIAVLWPVFDSDDRGFAIRPLLTKDGDQWEFLPPIAWCNTETGHWVFAPAYAFEDAFGLFPLFGIGSAGFRHFGPLWWNHDDAAGETSGGLFPLVYLSSELKVLVPIWWAKDAAGGSSFGLFPLVDFAASFSNIGPVVWSTGEHGELSMLTVFPLFGMGKTGNGHVLISLLGGAGWDDAGTDRFVNILGPVYHYDRSGDSESWNVVWPLFSRQSGPTIESWQLWPIAGRRVTMDAQRAPISAEVSALSHLFRMRGIESTDAIRFAPLFSVIGEQGGGRDLLDYLTLYGSRQSGQEFDLHLGTPLLFNYHSSADGYRWNSLLGMLAFDSKDDESSFNLLYYLYRQRTKGDETHRDFFPFITWDSGAQRSGFSFLWRLFDWRRDGDKVGGHILFIPWGDR